MNKTRVVSAFSTILLLGVMAPVVAAATLYVAPPPTGSNAMGDGSAAAPYQTIQFAFTVADSGDQIRVMPGTYNECINNFAFALGVQKNLDIVADDWIANGDRTSTIIDGTAACAPPFSVVNLGGSGPSGSRFEGFTVTGGVSSGVFVLGTGVVTHNTITGNTSLNGAGVYVFAGTCYYGNSNIVVSHNQITDNTADDGGICSVGGFACSSDPQCPIGSVCVFRGGDGGGLFVRADAVNPGGSSGCLGGDASITVDHNLVDGNGADRLFGAGIYAKTNTQTGRVSSVAITQNVISNNSMLPLSLGYGGGAWIGTYGFGTEQIDFIDNTVTSNTSTGDGGGVSAWIDAFGDGAHTINVTGNDVQLNTARGGGGGLDLFVFARELDQPNDGVQLNAAGNLVASNEAQGFEPTLYPGIGGGIAAIVWSQLSNSTVELNVVRNDVRLNTATRAGGGMSIVNMADADPDLVGSASPTAAHADLTNNLVAQNEAGDSGIGAGVGGGVFGYVEARGKAIASVDLRLNTIADNTTEDGAGGIEMESYTDFDAVGLFEGSATLKIDSSILATNDGFGIGGPVPGSSGTLTSGGTANFSLNLSFNDGFGNASGDYESWIAPGSSDISADPRLNPTYHLLSGSPAIDAGNPDSTGFPPTDLDGDDRILDGRVDMGSDEFSGPLNEPPVALAQADAETECSSPAGADLTLDGSGSTDPDSTPGTHDDIVAFEWFEDFGLPTQSLLGTGEIVQVALSLGAHSITLRVTDLAGETDTDTLTTEVVDTVAPTVEVTVDPSILSPPNHRMVAVTATVIATDTCGTPGVVLTSITSSQPDNAQGGGDGNTVNDIQDADPGLPDFEFSLRAERGRARIGRVYQVIYTATDGSGNSSENSADVLVPHGSGNRLQGSGGVSPERRGRR